MTETSEVGKTDDIASAVRRLSTFGDENPIVHDCTEIGRRLSRFLNPDEQAVLIAHWRPTKDGKRLFIPSASFLIGKSGYQTLDQIPDLGDIEQLLNKGGEKSILQVARVLGAAPLEWRHARNVSCMLPSRWPASVQAEIAKVYERMLFTSINFRGLVQGRLYYLSKPTGQNSPHPNFESGRELAVKIAAEFGVSASYFLFTGARSTTSPAATSSNDFRQLDDKLVSEIVPCHDDKNFRRCLGLSVSRKQSKVGRTESAPGAEIDRGTHFCIFPAFDPSIRQTPIEGVLVLWSDEPIGIMAFEAGGTWLRELSARRHVDQARFLGALRERCDLALRELGQLAAPGRKDRKRAIEQVGNYMCAQICSLTNAESATVRLKHDTDGVIRRYAGHASLLVERERDARSAPAGDILTAAWQTSAVAFAFQDATPDPIIYLPDVDNIPDVYAESGLQRILRTRQHTRCEAVVRVLRGGLLAAVINVESPIGDSLKHEEGFLKACASTFSTFLTQMETLADRIGLATLAEMHVEVHSVKTSLVTWKPSETDKATELLLRLRDKIQDKPDRHLDSAVRKRTSSVEAFNNAWREEYRHYLQETFSSAAIDDVFVGAAPPDFPKADLASLEVIMDSIWTNVRKHTQVQKSKITVETRPQGYGPKRVLLITWRSPKGLPKALNRDRLLLHPAISNHSLHFGFFLLGVHARLLGGHVELKETDAEGFSLYVYIPYAPEPAAPKAKSKARQ